MTMLPTYSTKWCLGLVTENKVCCSTQNGCDVIQQLITWPLYQKL